MHQENQALFEKSLGSIHNHQAYEGGYTHHLEEAMNIALVLHNTYSDLRPLPFSLSDALLVLYLHDLEKPWKYELVDGQYKMIASMVDKDAQHRFRLQKIKEYGIALTPEQENGIEYVEGENSKHSYYKRTRGPLAAFCGLCDSTSARIWFEYPKADDTWKNNVK